MKEEEKAAELIMTAKKRAGYKSDESFSEAAKISFHTFCRRKKHIYTMSLGEFRRIARTAALTGDEILRVVRGDENG